MSLSNKELAEGLGVAKGHASLLRKRGCPIDSIEAALAWRRIHAPERRKRKPRDPLLPVLKQEEVEVTLDKDWDSRLERARTTEVEVHKSLMKALAHGDLVTLQRLQAAHISSVREIAAAEKIAVEARMASGELIHSGSVKSIMTELLMPIRQGLDLMPAGLRSQCNPQAPDIAQAALTEWRDKLYARIMECENRF